MEGAFFMRVVHLRRGHVVGFLSAALILALCWQLFVLGKNIVAAVFKPVNDWGVAYDENGAPRGNVDAQTLAGFGALYVGSDADKVLYLTFDAGYENGYTAAILDTLKRHDVRAAFFLVGHYISTNGDLVRRMVEEGHIVANHTFHHYDMSKISNPADFERELQELEDLFFETTGARMRKYYRPPEGKFSERNLSMAQKLGYTTFFWSLAYADWDNNNQPSHDLAFSKLIPRTHNGAIVLLHSTSRTNAEILDALLTQWKEQGYAFGSLDDLAATLAPTAQ
jgi:peptidoglycan-N-acetylmuramic acid deacetylase